MFLRKSHKEPEFRKFYDQTHRIAYGFALKHSNSESTAEELLQIAYLKVWERFEELPSDLPVLKAYLFTTIRNLVIKEYHRRIAEQEAVHLFNQLNELDSSEEEVAERTSELKQAIATLPKKQQQVFKLIKFEGRTYREVAQELAISESTVEKHVIKALRTLRQKLSDFTYQILL